MKRTLAILAITLALPLTLFAFPADCQQCNTNCTQLGNTETCTTRCYGNGSMSTCVRTCSAYGGQVNCRTNCY